MCFESTARSVTNYLPFSCMAAFGKLVLSLAWTWEWYWACPAEYAMYFESFLFLVVFVCLFSTCFVQFYFACACNELIHFVTVMLGSHNNISVLVLVCINWFAWISELQGLLYVAFKGLAYSGAYHYAHSGDLVQSFSSCASHSPPPTAWGGKNVLKLIVHFFNLGFNF